MERKFRLLGDFTARTSPRLSASWRIASPLLVRRGAGGDDIYMSGNTKILYIAKALRQDMTKAEKILWRELGDGKLGFRFRRQEPLVLGVYNFIIDFYCPQKRLIIEIDGGVHNKREIKEVDLIREDILKQAGYKIIRFKNKEVENNIEAVLNKIRKDLFNSPSPD
ncbi:MAG: endonuclease domain-containing protein [Patescibacteria group bacterium]